MIRIEERLLAMNPLAPQELQLKIDAARQAPEGRPITVSSGEVLRGQQELHINHGDAIYTLRVTRQGKLILTK